jgi:hypothetical protein
MDVKLFRLTTSDDENNVFAVGMSIRCDDGDQDAVTFRRDPLSGQSMFATFSSPERARDRFSVVVPLTLEWINGQHDGAVSIGS